MFIYENNNAEGNLLFAISTASECPIELLKVEIEYSAPLQLYDPKKMGFFQYGNSNDDELPFSIYCEDVYQINPKVIHAFALTARFPSGSRELPVRILVHARIRASSKGGFDSHGRTQITRFFYRVALSDKPLLGLPLPPQYTLTSPQPFVVQSAKYWSGDSISCLIHEQMEDGTASSTLFEMKRDRDNPL